MLVLSARHRHTGQTRMNRESSRSHSVFTCVIQSKTIDQAGIITTLTSRLNLVDLAGEDLAHYHDTWPGLQLCCSAKAPGAGLNLASRFVLPCFVGRSDERADSPSVLACCSTCV